MAKRERQQKKEAIAKKGKESKKRALRKGE